MGSHWQVKGLLAKELGLSAREIARGIENVRLPEGRSQVKKMRVKNGAEIFLMQDCYNANPESMKKALEFCGTLKISGLVDKLAPILRLGADEPENELVFRQFRNVLMRPGGNTAVDIGIGPLKNETYFHAFLLTGNPVRRDRKSVV